MTGSSRPSARARANRLNAQKSTGPRSAAGKARVALNALAHGLCAQTRTTAEPEADRLARQIAGPNAHPERLALARDVASAHMAALRARRARDVLMTCRPEMTLEELAAHGREIVRALDLIGRVGEYERLSTRVYKGRPLKIDNYPRFRNLAARLEASSRRMTALLTREPMEAIGPSLFRQARLLQRYEIHALGRRKRAIAAFDRLDREHTPAISDGCPPTSKTKPGPQAVNRHSQSDP